MNNKPGERRGRPKGSKGTHFVKVKLSQLIAELGTNFTVVVSKKWLADIGIEVKAPESGAKLFLTPVNDEPKIQFNVTE